ncbi:MAG: hypothetical protein JWN13_6260 [Betaproteobacteria bacterium]|nr:hypothetical protein [Betaproteobacteria bacterium]
MSKRPKWSALLSRPVPVRDGPVLRTLKQAAILTMFNKETGKRSSWQSAARKLMLAAETGNKGDIEDATKQIELALFMESRLGFEQTR